MAEPLYVDNSQLKAVARCSTEAMVRYVLHWTTAEERAALLAGTAFHKAMEAHFQGETSEVALKAFTDNYSEWGEANVATTDRLHPTNLVRILNHWLETHAVRSLPFQVAHDLVEIGFSFPLTDEGDIVFCGRIDAIATYEGGHYIVEHKSTGRISADWLDAFHLDSQLSGYIWAAGQHLGEPVVGAFLNAVEFSKLPGSAGKCKTHGVPYSECGHLHANAQIAVVTRTEAQLVEWRKTATTLARRFAEMKAKWPTLAHLHKVRTQGTFNGSCRWCSFKELCKLGRSVEYIHANLIHDPWSPFDHAAKRTTDGH